jgi:hypothetical protein
MATTTGFKVQCPSCETMVAIKNASLVGKKIDCPKCKYRFTVEAPADVADEAGKAKAKAGAPAGAKRSRARDDDDDAPKKKKKGSSTLVVGLIVAVLALGALGVGGAYLAGAFDDESGSDGNPRWCEHEPRRREHRAAGVRRQRAGRPAGQPRTAGQP